MVLCQCLDQTLAFRLSAGSAFGLVFAIEDILNALLFLLLAHLPLFWRALGLCLLHANVIGTGKIACQIVVAFHPEQLHQVATERHMNLLLLASACFLVLCQLHLFFGSGRTLRGLGLCILLFADLRELQVHQALVAGPHDASRAIRMRVNDHVNIVIRLRTVRL